MKAGSSVFSNFMPWNIRIRQCFKKMLKSAIVKT
jgi:hypothetical protein